MGAHSRRRSTGGTPIAEPRVNDRIRVKRVRLIAPDGGQIGEKDIDEARWLAAQLGLDLVEVAPDARPPVVRMMDYGKFKYDQSVKAREARKNQTRTVIKEVQFRPKIGKSDFEVKRKRVIKFLRQGDKIKCTMRFRGREVAHPELGRDILQRLYESVEDYAEIEAMPRLDGRNMTMVLGPSKDMPAEDPSDAEYDTTDVLQEVDVPTEGVVEQASAEAVEAPIEAVVEQPSADAVDAPSDGVDVVESDDEAEDEDVEPTEADESEEQ